MVVRKIGLYSQNPDPLRRKSEPVERVNTSVRKLIQDQKDSLYSHPEGIGLAAPQINLHQRVVQVHLGGRDREGQEPGPPLALVNPIIIEAGNEQLDFDGCLSFPGLFADTIRAHYLPVTGLDESGGNFDRVFE